MKAQRSWTSCHRSQPLKCASTSRTRHSPVVISLHARVDGADPASWEDPSLAQIWGPRGADYVVPRDDLPVFTVGRLPRDAEQAAALERMADDVHEVLDGSARETREVARALPDLGHGIRATAVTGRVLIRWDASRIRAVPAEPPDADPEEARLELARRFLRWFAPAAPERFAWWSGVDPADARATWTGLDPELREVDVAGEARVVLREDEEALAGAEPVEGVRLIPHGDPYIKIDGELVVRDPERRLEIFPRPGVKTAFWPVAGAVLVDGEVVGSWARRQRRVTVHPWGRLGGRVLAAIEREALGFPIASKSKAEVRWAT